MDTTLKILIFLLKAFVVVLGLAFFVAWLMFKVALSAMAPATQGQRIQPFYRY